MKLWRVLLASVMVAALGGSAVAQTASDPGVFGGGFVREGKGKGAKKASVTIEGFDREEGDSGRARYAEHSPGSGKPMSVTISLDCVVVDDDVAYASGTASSSNDDYDGESVAIQIVDDGEGAGSADEFGVEVIDPLDAIIGIVVGDCGAGSVSTRSISGGNFQVIPAE